MSSDDFVEDPSGAASGYVQATADCAHLDKVVTTDSFSPDLFTAKCHDCDNVVENWVCLNCYQTFCGRFAKRHMVKHNEATGHCIVVSLADLSCWCYECDQYLDHLSIRPIFETYRALHVIKFNKQSVQKFQGAASEDEKSQKQKDQRDAETMKTILAQQRQQQRPQSGAGQASSSSPALPAVEEEASEDEAEEPEENEDGGGQKFVEMMAKLMKAETGDETPDEEKASEGPLKAADVASFAEAIKSGAIKKVVVMAGAGISVSAGIPDFRSPKTGLYANLAKYNLPHPEAVFEIDYFRTNPKPFCTLAKELYPGSFNPTPAHFFIKLLADKGLLVRCYTQNIDGLEFHAGLSSDQVIQAHGGFQTAHCLSCRELYPEKYCKDFIFRDEVPKCAKCEGLVKPDIVFFGESLPARFHQSVPVDFSGADALIVMGTSLKVQPFASLVDRVPSSAARLLINLEKVGTAGNMGFLERLLMGTRGFDFDSPSNKRDVFIQDSTDSGVRVLADALGWRAELDKLIADGSKLTDSKL